MPIKNKGKISEGIIRRHQAKLNRIVDDERIGPNRRLLASLMSLYLSAVASEDSKQEAFTASVILGEFVNRNGFRLFDRGNQTSPIPLESQAHTNLELNAVTSIKAAFKSITKNLQEEGFLAPEDASTIQSEQE